jgi:hypothetical protein
MFVALNIINSDRSADARTALSITVSGAMAPPVRTHPLPVLRLVLRCGARG